MKNLFFIALIIFTFGCQQKNTSSQKTQPEAEYFYQYSVLAGLNNAVFDGELSIEALKTKGDLGLGSYADFDGELVMFDGICYQVLESGKIQVASQQARTPYAVATFFDTDKSLKVDQPIDYPKLKKLIESKLPSNNYFYAFKIKGTFNSIHCGGAPKQEKPYTKTLAEIIPIRPQFTAENISGIIVGFWCPAYVGEVTLKGFHLHFIADDLKTGGHLINFQSSNLQIDFDEIKRMEIDLPDTPDFKNAVLNSNQGY